MTADQSEIALALRVGWRKMARWLDPLNVKGHKPRTDNRECYNCNRKPRG